MVNGVRTERIRHPVGNTVTIAAPLELVLPANADAYVLLHGQGLPRCWYRWCFHAYSLPDTARDVKSELARVTLYVVEGVSVGTVLPEPVKAKL